MTTKQERYQQSLKGKGLIKICLIVPIDSAEEIKAKAEKLRVKHLKRVG